MLQKYQFQYTEEPKTADSFSRLFQPLGYSYASTQYSKLSQQLHYQKKKIGRPQQLPRSQPNGNNFKLECDEPNQHDSLDEKIQKELAQSEVVDWQKFMQKEFDAIQDVTDQAERDGLRRSSKIFGSPLKKAQSQIDLLDKRMRGSTDTEREQFFQKMKLGNKIVGGLNNEDFHRTIRNERRLNDYARLYKQEPVNLYLSLNFNQNHQVPKSYGLVYNSHKVNSSRYLRKKSDVRAYSSALSTRQAKNITTMQLNNNNIDHSNIRQLLFSLPQGLKELELQDCKLSFLHMETIMQFAQKFQIYKLSLEQNNIRDQGCKIIMKYLMINNTLTYINLNNNKITDQSCMPISNLLKQTQTLIEFYIGYNMFNNSGGTQIWKSMYKNTSVKILDMSHNHIASMECAQAIAKAIARPYNELLHLDLSYNKFNSLESQVIAESLIKNETIFGFHFEGNQQQIIVNPNGFLTNFQQDKINRKAKLDLLYKEEQVFRLLDEEKQETLPEKEELTERVYSFQRQRKIKSTKQAPCILNRMNQLDSCWICEGWQETRFEWTPQRSGGMYNEPIFIHIDFEGYRPLLLTNLNNEFFLVKMCPPKTQIKYFFTNPILGIQTIAQDQQMKKLKEPIPQQPFLYNDEILVDGNSMSEVNVLFTGNEGQLFDKYMNLVQCKPREKLALFDFSPYLKTKKICWSIETSIFRYFQPDSDKLIADCFEFDYQNSKIGRLVKESELPDSKEILKTIYNGLFHVYKYFASSNTIQLPCLTVNDYIDFLIQTNLMEGLKTNDIDISFTSTAGAKDVTFPQAYEKGLVRCQFLEIMIRLCNDKYIRPGVFNTMPEALSNLQLHCQEFFDRFDKAQDWRKTRYWTQKVDIMIHDRMAMFKLLFKFACKLSKKPQQFKFDFVSAQDFRDLFNQCKMICDDLNEKECYLVYLQSMQTQKDELFSAKHYQMNFYEFLEGCCRIAEKLSIIRGDKPMELEDRRVKDLQSKIDGFLLLIYLTLGNEMKQAFPNDKDSRNVDKCMINDFKSLKQKLEDSFTDEDKPPYNPIVELPHLSAQISYAQMLAQQNKKQSLRQQVKQQRKEESSFSLVSFVSFFKKVQPQL